MQNLFKERHQILGLILVLYIVPLCIVTSFSLKFISPSQSWDILSLGLFSSIAGAMVIFFALRKFDLIREDNLTATPAISELNLLERKVTELEESNESLVRQIQEQERSIGEAKECTQVSDEFSVFKKETEKKLEQNELYIHELHQEISEQKRALQEKEKWIADLESQVQDRTYELQTLLKLSEIHPSKKEVLAGREEETLSFPFSGTPFRSSLPSFPSHEETENEKIHTAEGVSHLKRCIAIAQKMTGANHFSNGSSLFRDLPVNSYALDLRRLCDSLGSENLAAVALYSKKEGKLLFANPEIKNLLGWSPEKFLQDFSEIVQEGYTDWKNKIYSLVEFEEAKVRLLVKTKSGENLLLNCHLGIIPTGIFRNHAIAVFYPA